MDKEICFPDSDMQKTLSIEYISNCEDSRKVFFALYRPTNRQYDFTLVAQLVQ